ncbi:Alpha/Beta hydrolase protein [Blakeslea trispora]|nr:Alpha/Beta hydrolase protein [Blakeslea trispora]
MFQLIKAFVASGYIFSAIISSFSIVCAFDYPAVRNFFYAHFRRYVMHAEILSGLATEFALQWIMLKLISIQIVKFLGGFNYTLAWLFYFVDLINIIGLGALFYEMLTEISVANDTIKKLDHTSQPLKSFLSIIDFQKLINPFWTSDGIKKHPNITYATNEEIQEALRTTNNDYNQPRRMMLDVYTYGEKPNGLRPVLILIHGGAWRIGSKNTLYPHEKILLTDSNWVVVNAGYRLAPTNAYPTHLCDVKRAIRWVKQNIASFGGDPNFIVMSGDSAGGHLSAMASMTMNDPQFQPGFEDVDTSVRGVVSLSGALDMMSAPHHASFFCKEVANLDRVDMEFLSRHSPAQVIPKAKEQNKLVPFLLIAGNRDSLVEIDINNKFKATYDEVTGSDSACTYVVLPGGHHVSYLTWSPRSFYMSRVIQTWCNQLYLKHK